MLATESAPPGGARKMLKPLVEKRRRDRINKNLEELRLLLLQKTHCQTLKNPKVEKAEILELAVRYLQERQKAAEAQGADPSEDGGLRTCYATGFQACFGHLASFLQRSPPSVQRHLREMLRLSLASTSEPSGPDWTSSAFSPGSPSEESPAATPGGSCPRLQPSRTFASSEGASHSTGQLRSLPRDPQDPEREASVKNISLQPPLWRPWP